MTGFFVRLQVFIPIISVVVVVDSARRILQLQHPVNACQGLGLTALNEILDDRLDVVWQGSSERSKLVVDASFEGCERRLVDNGEAILAERVPICEYLFNEDHLRAEGHVVRQLACKRAEKNDIGICNERVG